VRAVVTHGYGRGHTVVDLSPLHGVAARLTRGRSEFRVGDEPQPGLLLQDDRFEGLRGVPV
jgi:hypothetical protein